MESKYDPFLVRRELGENLRHLRRVDQEKGIIFLQNLDVIDNSPVLDLKPYLNWSDRVKDATLPKYLDFFETAKWFPEDGLELDLKCIKLLNEDRISEYYPTNNENE